MLSSLSSLSKSLKMETVAIGTAVGIAVVLLIMFLAAYAMEGERPFIATAHVINLDRDVKKLAAFQKQPFPFPVERWTATYGKDLNAYSLPEQGVGSVIYIKGKGAYGLDQSKDLRNLGAIGCFLSHRALLQHCATLQVPDTAGHLILEDDVAVDDTFQRKWDERRLLIPKDWDIVYLGIHSPIGNSIGNDILKLQPTSDDGKNVGTHAYIVRHGVLRTSLLPFLENMTDAIDQMYKRKFSTLNVYGFKRALIGTDETMESTIQTM